MMASLVCSFSVTPPVSVQQFIPPTLANLHFKVGRYACTVFIYFVLITLFEYRNLSGIIPSTFLGPVNGKNTKS